MFVAALFTIVKTWEQPKCPATDEWIKMKYMSILRTPGEVFGLPMTERENWLCPTRMHEALSCLMLPWSLRKAERSLWIKEAFSLGSGLTLGISESQAFAFLCPPHYEQRRQWLPQNRRGKSDRITSHPRKARLYHERHQ